MVASLAFSAGHCVILRVLQEASAEDSYFSQPGGGKPQVDAMLRNLCGVASDGKSCLLCPPAHPPTHQRQQMAATNCGRRQEELLQVPGFSFPVPIIVGSAALPADGKSANLTPTAVSGTFACTALAVVRWCHVRQVALPTQAGLRTW